LACSTPSTKVGLDTKQRVGVGFAENGVTEDSRFGVIKGSFFFFHGDFFGSLNSVYVFVGFREVIKALNVFNRFAVFLVVGFIVNEGVFETGQTCRRRVRCVDGCFGSIFDGFSLGFRSLNRSLNLVNDLGYGLLDKFGSFRIDSVFIE